MNLHWAVARKGVRDQYGYAMIDCANENSGRDPRPVCLLSFSR